MGLFDFLKPNPNNGQFVSESAFNKNRKNQIQMLQQTLKQLREINVTAKKELKLEFFFYTNTAENAEEFANEIKKLNYTVEYGVSGADKNLFLITGWTNKMKIAEETIEQWVDQMCTLGYQYDCEFDGWGTTPDQ